MSISGRFQARSKSKGHQEIVLLTDELESTIGRLKANAAERKASKPSAKGGLSPSLKSPSWKSPLRRAHTDVSSAPRTPSRCSESGAGGGRGPSELTRANSLGGGEPLRRKPSGGPHAHQAGGGPHQLPPGRSGPPIPRRKTDDAASIKEDEVSVVGAAELAPGSPFSSHASSYSVGQVSAMSEGTAARLPRFDISSFSLASAPVSPQVSAAPTPAHSSVTLPPPSPDATAQHTCFSFITPKQIEKGVQTPFGWLVSLLCSYQAVVHERQQHLFVMRHDERADVADPVWKETAERPWDPPLSDKGKAHAYQVGLRLRRESVDIHRVVCSPYLRCVETAAEVVRALLASEDEVLEQAGGLKGAKPRGPSSSSSRAPAQPQAPVGCLGYRQRLLGQMTHSAALKAKQGQQAGAWPGLVGRGKGRMKKKTKVRCHIEPGLCEIRTGSGIVPPPAPQNRLLLPRVQLESLLPSVSLRSAGTAPVLLPPSWPEDISVGLHRLVGTGDRICEQFPQENIILITHAEALQAEVLRCVKRASVYNIKFGAFVHLERTVYVDTEDEDDRGVSPWKLATKSGSTGVYFSG